MYARKEAMFGPAAGSAPMIRPMKLALNVVPRFFLSIEKEGMIRPMGLAARSIFGEERALKISVIPKRPMMMGICPTPSIRTA